MQKWYVTLFTVNLVQFWRNLRVLILIYCYIYQFHTVWNNDVFFSSNVFKTYETTYSSAMKKTARCLFCLFVCFSNHGIAHQCNLLKHHAALVQARYFKLPGRKKPVIFILKIFKWKHVCIVFNLLKNTYNQFLKLHCGYNFRKN